MYVSGTPSIRILGLLILYPQIDFNAVGAATNLKASAARMRYSRLRKNIETTLGESSRKAPVGSTETSAIKKVKTSAKKRKISYDSEDDEHDLATLDEDIGSVVIKNEELQQWTVGPRTRGKKIDLKQAFDSDSSSGPGLHKQDDGSSDEYKMEDVSEDEDELHTDEAHEDEAGQPVSRRRKSGSQSTNRNVDTARSVITAFERLSRPLLRSVPDEGAKETLAKSEVRLTPERGTSGPSEIKAKDVTLPPTLRSTPISVMKQEPADLISTVPKIRPAPQRSTATRTSKITHATPQPSLFDRIESARIQADYKLASLSHQANKNSRYLGDNSHPDNEVILPSIERDDEDIDGDMLNASRNTSSMATAPPILHSRMLSSAGNADTDKNSRSTTSTRGDNRAFEETPLTARTERDMSSAAPSTLSIKTKPSSSATAKAVPERGPTLDASADTPESCTVQ